MSATATPSPIRRFQITGLFGDRNVDIVFDDPVTVLIADNGSGKTTILSIIYAVLSRQLFKLIRYDFEEIIVETADNRKLVISKDDVSGPAAIKSSRFGRYFPHVPYSMVRRAADEIRGLTSMEIRRHSTVNKLAEITDVPAPQIAEMLIADFWGGEHGGVDKYMEATSHLQSELEAAFPYANLYFPTYRRIEEELEDLG